MDLLKDCSMRNLRVLANNLGFFFEVATLRNTFSSDLLWALKEFAVDNGFTPVCFIVFHSGVVQIFLLLRNKCNLDGKIFLKKETLFHFYRVTSSI